MTKLPDVDDIPRVILMAEAIGEIGDRLGLPILRDLLVHYDKRVREAAANSLKTFGLTRDEQIKFYLESLPNRISMVNDFALERLSTLICDHTADSITLSEIKIDIKNNTVNGNQVIYDPFLGEYLPDKFNEEACTVLINDIKIAFRKTRRRSIISVIRQLLVRTSVTPQWPDQDFATVLREIVRNSFQHGDKVTTIVMKARIVVEKQSLKKNGEVFVMTVTDNGIGLSRVDTMKIFNKGYTTGGGPARKDRGFGLFLCKSFIEARDGATVQVFDNIHHLCLPESGCTLEVRIPLFPSERR